MKIRLWPRSSPEGHREVTEEEARRIEREGRPNPFAIGWKNGLEHGAGRPRDALEQSLRFFEERRADCLRRGSEHGALLAEGFLAALRTQLRDLPEPQGPTGVLGVPGDARRGPNGEWFGGPTGPVPMIEHVESKGKPDEIRTGYATTTSLGSTGGVPRFVGFRDGEWYAFRLYRLAHDESIAEELYAAVTVDSSTGFLELREIPDPWACWICGLGYQEGAHRELGFDGPDAHDYTARGAPAEEPES